MTVGARPKILTLNRMAAELISGEKLGYISTTPTETATTQTVEFLEVGTTLTVRPFATDDGFIRMEIRPKVSEGDVRVVQGFVIPDETTNEMTVNVLVPNGRTVVLGGLFKEDTGTAISYGTLYTTFRRLTEGKWVTAKDQGDGDGRIRLFRITGAGVRALQRGRDYYRELAGFGEMLSDG